MTDTVGLLRKEIVARQEAALSEYRDLLVRIHAGEEVPSDEVEPVLKAVDADADQLAADARRYSRRVQASHLAAQLDDLRSKRSAAARNAAETRASIKAEKKTFEDAAKQRQRAADSAVHDAQDVFDDAKHAAAELRSWLPDWLKEKEAAVDEQASSLRREVDLMTRQIGAISGEFSERVTRDQAKRLFEQNVETHSTIAPKLALARARYRAAQESQRILKSLHTEIWPAPADLETRLPDPMDATPLPTDLSPPPVFQYEGDREKPVTPVEHRRRVPVAASGSPRRGSVLGGFDEAKESWRQGNAESRRRRIAPPGA